MISKLARKGPSATAGFNPQRSPREREGEAGGVNQHRNLCHGRQRLRERRAAPRRIGGRGERKERGKAGIKTTQIIERKS